MKNLPMFTAVNGMASLILQEIPYTGKAYILIRSVWTTAQALLDECRSFCRMAGAETIFASWDKQELPGTHAYDLIAMACTKAQLPVGQPVELVPLAPENGQAYLDIYNTCFREVPGAATYCQRDLKRLYNQDTAWLARVNGAFAAVAEISQTGLEGIAVLPEHRGLGFDLAAQVLQMVPSLTVQLKVASTNERAIRLYRKLGFAETEIVSRWFRLE